MRDNSSSAVESQPRTGVIYKITNALNGKCYVGQTRQKLNRRLNGHKSNKGKSAIDAAIKKYGWENFTVAVIEECPVEQLDEREMFWIAALNTKIPNGYNLTDGGLCNSNPSEETRAKISAHHADFSGEKNGFYGKHHSEEARAKMSAAKKGKSHKPHSPETRAKISASSKGKHSQNRGRKHTTETRAKIAVARKAYWAKKKLESQNNL